MLDPFDVYSITTTRGLTKHARETYKMFRYWHCVSLGQYYGPVPAGMKALAYRNHFLTIVSRATELKCSKGQLQTIMSLAYKSFNPHK